MREITTPTLPSFITACLNLISSKPAGQEARQLKPGPGLLEPVLCAFIKLFPNHPTTFRPFSAQIHDVILPLVGSTQSPTPAQESTAGLAHKLFISLHHCAPKNSSGDEWLKACRSTILSIHRTGNYLFRAISEQWETVDPLVRELPTGRDFRGQVGDAGPDALGLGPWTGVSNGSRKMVALLKLLSHFLLIPTNSTVSIPVGSILDLASRLSSITVPTPGVDVSGIVNPEIGRDERESLWSVLPGIHVATMDLLRTVVETLGSSSLSIARTCLEQTLWVFESESFNNSLRTATYRLIEAALPVIGYTLAKSDIQSLAPAIRSSCRDLLEPLIPEKHEQPQRGSNKAKSKSGHGGTSNADAFLNLQPKGTAAQSVTLNSSAITTAAAELLSTFLTCVPVELVPSSLRAEIDRTSILVQHKQTMLASVLNPVPSTARQRAHASILPFLARSNSGDLSVEALLRPRMPVLMGGGAGKGGLGQGVYEDEEEVDQRTEENERVEYSAAATAFKNTTSEEGLLSRNKRAYETEVAKVDETVAPGKRVRTESHQATSIRAAGANQGLKDLPSLKPCAAGTSSEAREEITVPDVLPSSVVDDSIPPPATAESQVSSELKISQPPTVQPATAVQDDEESDDDIPVLNMESDTDDEMADE